MEAKKEELNKFEKMLMGEPILVSKNYPMERMLNTSNMVIENYPRIKTTETHIAFDYDKGYLGNTYKEPISTAEAICLAAEMISDSILDLTRVHQEVGQMVAEAIISASNNIAYSIRQVVDEMERKNKLDEYYMLLDKIEKYEDELIKMGVINETYEKIELIKYPTIDVDERCQWLLLNLEEEDRATVLAISKRTYTNPLKVLENILSSTPNSWFVGKESGIIEINTRMNKRVKLPWKRFRSKDENRLLGCMTYDDLIGNDKIDLGHVVLIYSGEKEELCNLKLIEPETIGKRLIELVYNSITDEATSRMKLHKSYVTLMSELDAINRDITLANLRSLYLQLRTAVRKYKISKSNE